LEAKKTVHEKAEKKRIEEEEKRKLAEKAERDEEERRSEEERKRQVETMIQQEEKQQEQRKKDEEATNKGLTLSTVLWQSLHEKDYMQIDNTFFNMQIENNQTVIGVFKNVSNVMYLMAFRIDENKGNAIYREQTISIKFDENGHGIKFDNTPVRIKGMLPPNDVLFVANNGHGGLQVNRMELCNDPEYVSGIMKNAKKPMLSFSKVFL